MISVPTMQGKHTSFYWRPAFTCPHHLFLITSLAPMFVIMSKVRQKIIVREGLKKKKLGIFPTIGRHPPSKSWECIIFLFDIWVLKSVFM